MRPIVRAISINLRDEARINWAFPLRHIAALLGKKSQFETKIPEFGPITIRTNSSDAAVVLQVFGNRDYELGQFRQFARVQARYAEICKSGKSPIIIDAGANIGAASIWFGRKFPKARILAVEPDPENAICCRLNTRNYSNIEVIEAAIGSSSGNATLNYKTGEAWSIRSERNNAGSGIRIITVKELVRPFSQENLFIVKVDIEGFEEDLFDGDTSWLAYAHTVIIEPHDWMMPGEGRSLPFQKAMAQYRYELLVSGENIFYFKL
jgi:FkbM family methyltransferase